MRRRRARCRCPTARCSGTHTLQTWPEASGSRRTAEPGVSFLEHFSFLLALRIAVLKEVWVWLGEGRTLEGTDFSVMRTEVVGTEEEGWQVALSYGSGIGATVGWRRGRERPGWGQSGRHLGPEARFAPCGTTSSLGNQGGVLQAKQLSSDRSPRSVSYHWGVRAGLLFCKLSFLHPSANPGNVVPRPATQPGPRETLHSEAKGGHRPPPVCPVGPSSHLLPWPNPAWGVRLHTLQVRLHVSGFGGARASCPEPPRPCVHLVFLEAGATAQRQSGQLHVCHTVTWAQTHRLRYKDKYKYYSQNLCINIFGEAWMISSSGRLFLEQ